MQESKLSISQLQPESWRGAQRPTIGADELQKCGLTVSLKMSIFHSTARANFKNVKNFMTNTAERVLALPINLQKSVICIK